MTTSAPDIQSIFNSVQASYERAVPDAGPGEAQEWPEDGLHRCRVLGVNTRASTIRRDDGLEIPCVIVQFGFQMMEDPTHEVPLTFQGAYFEVVDESQLASTPEGKRKATAISINMRRLVNHISKLLGRPVSNLGADLREVEKLLSSSNVVAQVKIQSRTGKNDKVYRSEYITEVEAR